MQALSLTRLSVNKIIEQQLKKLEYADISNFDAATNTYIIPKKVDIKIEEDKCYLIQLLPTLFKNEVLKTNWNAGSMPMYNYMKIDVSKIIGKMIKVVGTGYDIETQTDISSFWSGWLSTQDIKVIKKI